MGCVDPARAEKCVSMSSHACRLSNYYVDARMRMECMHQRHTGAGVASAVVPPVHMEDVRERVVVVRNLA